MIDTHCHLTDPKYDDDRADVITRAQEAGVMPLMAMSDSLEEGERCLKLSAEYDQIFCSIGVHPHHAKDWKESDGERLKKLLQSSPKVKVVGEIGLDYHYDHSPRETQRDVFRKQLLIAKELKIPFIVHCREAISEVREIIEECDHGPFVIHCCTEVWDDVSWVVERGCFLSFTGMVTFPNSSVIRETVKRCPLESILTETDAPYLAPVPYRGKRCEPMHVVEVAKAIAAEKGISYEEVDRVTTANAIGFFGL